MNAGGSWNSLTGPGIDIDVKPKGAIGGIHGGYNWQSGSFVFGVEGDISASGAKWTFDDGFGGVTVKSTYLASLRARAGFASGPALLYVTGGAAFTNLKVNDAFGFGFSSSGSGWVAGGGVEYMMSSNLALRVEGLHNRFSLDAGGDKGKYTVNELRAGLTYKF